MNCDEVSRYLTAYLDSALDVKTDCEIVRHLESCPECARRFALEGRLERSLRAALRLDRPDAALWERVRAPVSRERARDVRRGLRVGISAGAAACLVAVAGFVTLVRLDPPASSSVLFSRELERMHQSYAEGRESFRSLDSLPAGVAQYFERQIGLTLDAAFDSDHRLHAHGVHVNFYRDVPLGVIIASSEEIPITFFIIRQADAGRIAGLREWLGDSTAIKEGDLERYHFAIAATEPGALVCVVSELPCKYLAHYLASQ